MADAFKTALRLGLEAVHRSGLGGLASRVLPRSGVIFALHRVKPADDCGFAPNRLLEVTPEFLDATIKTVRAQGFDIISLDDALPRMSSRSPRPFACFTFDDAYRDNKDFAVPVLQKNNVPFTIYVPEHFADGIGQLWWVELERAIAASERITVPELFAQEQLVCGTVLQKYDVYGRVYWRLRKMDEVRARAAVRRLCLRARVDAGKICSDLIMTWDGLRDLAKDPLAGFGAHSMSHLALAQLHPEQAFHEMAGSKVRLEAELGRPCRHFCYPYGDEKSAGPRDFGLARQAGFASAVTMRKGLIQSRHHSDLFSLPRCSLNGEYQNQRYVSALLSGLPFLLWNGVSRRNLAACARSGHGHGSGLAGPVRLLSNEGRS